MAVATVNSDGEPRVAPVDSVFFHGKFYVSTDTQSRRASNLNLNPAVSLTYFESADPLVIVHGMGVFIHRGDSTFPNLDLEWVKEYGKSITQLSDTVLFIRVEPKTMLAYSFHPERFSAPSPEK